MDSSPLAQYLCWKVCETDEENPSYHPKLLFAEFSSRSKAKGYRDQLKKLHPNKRFTVKHVEVTIKEHRPVRRRKKEEGSQPNPLSRASRSKHFSLPPGFGGGANSQRLGADAQGGGNGGGGAVER